MRSVTISRLLSGLLASFLIGGLAPALLPGYVALGQSGQSSLALNGTSAYAEAPSASELNTIADWTVEAWFKDETPTGYSHARERIITKGDTATSSDVPYFIDVTTSSLFVGRRVSSTSQVLSFGLSGVTANAWHHVAATFQATPRRLTLYLDGNQVATNTFTGVNIGNTNPVSIGRNGGTTTNFWNGKLDDIRIWNVARTTTEIQANFQSELASPPAGLVANWRFNEGTGTTAADDAGAAAQNASLLGSAAFSTDTQFPQPATPTPTLTSTAVPTDTPTNTPVPTDTPTNTPVPPTNTAVPTDTPTNTPVPPTNTPVPTDTPTNTPVPPTNTVVPTDTPTNTPVPLTNTSVPTSTAVPTETPTNTPVPPTNTAVPTETPTNTPVPPTNTAVPTSTPTNTSVPPTNTAVPTSTPTNTSVPPTNTPVPTSTSTALPTSTATATTPPTQKDDVTNTPTATSVPPTSTRTPTATSIPPTATSTRTPLPSATSIPQATATETAQPLNNLNVGPTVVPTAIPVANLVVQRPFPYFYYVPRSEETPTPTYSAPTVVPTATSTPLPPPPTPDLRPRATPTSVVIALPALTEDWLLILLPTQVYSVDMEPLWMAEAGDWFRVIAAEDDYLLAVGADDADTPVWIEADATNVFRLTLEARGAGL